MHHSVVTEQRELPILWIDEVKAENLHITCSAVQQRVLEFAREQGNREFLASRGWLQFFKH